MIEFGISCRLDQPPSSAIGLAAHLQRAPDAVLAWLHSALSADDSLNHYVPADTAAFFARPPPMRAHVVDQGQDCKCQRQCRLSRGDANDSSASIHLDPVSCSGHSPFSLVAFWV